MNEKTASRRAFEYVQSRVPERRKGDDRSRLLNHFITKMEFKVEGEHWMWTACLHKGRPIFFWHLIGAGKRKRSMSSFSYLMRNFFPDVFVPRGMRFEKTCTEGRCISPFHRTQWDNVKCGKKARDTLAKLTLEEVRLIHKKLGGKETCAALAREYGVDRSTISHLKLGKTWPDAYEEVHGVRPVKNVSPTKRREYRFEARSTPALTKTWSWQPHQDREAMRAALREGGSTREVADRYGVSIRFTQRLKAGGS